MIYLCSPYSHPDPAVRHARYLAVCKKAAELILQEQVIFSPIAHSHPISEFMPPDKVTCFDTWMSVDVPILRRAETLAVLMLDGWQQSRGVAEEIRVATACRIPIRYLEP